MPEPAPARMSSGPSPCMTASRCGRVEALEQRLDATLGCGVGHASEHRPGPGAFDVAPRRPCDSRGLVGEVLVMTHRPTIETAIAAGRRRSASRGAERLPSPPGRRARLVRADRRRRALGDDRPRRARRRAARPAAGARPGPPPPRRLARGRRHLPAHARRGQLRLGLVSDAAQAPGLVGLLHRRLGAGRPLPRPRPVDTRAAAHDRARRRSPTRSASRATTS